MVLQPSTRPCRYGSESGTPDQQTKAREPTCSRTRPILTGEIVVEGGKPAILNGIERFAKVPNHDFGITVTDHISPPRSGTSHHRFAVEDFTVDGETTKSVAINADARATLDQCKQDPTEIPIFGGSVVDAPVGDRKCHSRWSGPNKGEEIGAMDKYGHIFVGYEFGWRLTVTGPRKDQACIRVHHLRFMAEIQNEFVLDDTVVDPESAAIENPEV